MAEKYVAYPEYKESGVEWLGEIPSGWKVVPIKYVANVNMGQSPSSDDVNDIGVGLPFLQGNADFSKFSPEARTWCPVPRKIAKKGDILFSVRAPVGAVNIADTDYGIGRGLCSIKGNHLLVQKFLAWLLPSYKYQFDAISTGSTFESVSSEEVNNLLFSLPSTVEQTQIANFLDFETAQIDNLIEKQQTLIQLLKEKRQAVISYAVTKGLNPDALMKESGVEWLGEVPEHWEVSPLKLYINTRKGVAFKSADFTDKGVRVVKASDIKDKTIRQSYVFLPAFFSEIYPKAILSEGDIVISTVGSTPDVKNSAVGQIGMVPEELDGSLLNQNTVVFTPRNNMLENLFLFYLIQTDVYRDHLDLNAHGTANQASLNVSDMLNFTFARPSFKEQSEISAHIIGVNSSFDNLEKNCLTAIQLMQERRTALISAAVTGKIDVRGWVAPESR